MSEIGIIDKTPKIVPQVESTIQAPKSFTQSITQACSRYLSELKKGVINAKDIFGKDLPPKPGDIVDCPAGLKIPIRGVDFEKPLLATETPKK